MITIDITKEKTEEIYEILKKNVKNAKLKYEKAVEKKKKFRKVKKKVNRGETRENQIGKFGLNEKNAANFFSLSVFLQTSQNSKIHFTCNKLALFQEMLQIWTDNMKPPNGPKIFNIFLENYSFLQK